MKYADLVRYLALKEQVAILNEEIAIIKDLIKGEVGEQGGEQEIGGIRFGATEKVRTNTDLEGLTAYIGPEKIARFQNTTTYLSVFVEPTSKALKKPASSG